MSSSFVCHFKSALPLSDRQLEDLYRIVEAMRPDDAALLFSVSNFRETGDIMAIYIEWCGRGRHVELDYPMDEYRWKFPLVLAGNLSVQKTKELLRRTLQDIEETADIDFVFNGFRSVPAVRYGADKPQEYPKG